MTSPVGSEPLPNARELFDIPDGIAYFNTASVAPTLRTGLVAGEAALLKRAQPWRLLGPDWFSGAERRRELFGELIGAGAGDIALVPATSYGFAVAAANLTARAGERILVLDGEYPSGIYTWWRLAERTGASMLTVRREPGQTWTEAVLDALDESVAVVSVPRVHWTDGALLDLDRIAGAARDAGAALVIDASQSVGAIPIDVRTLKPDFLVSVGYKWLLGPFGLGYLYVAPARQEGRPLEENWIVRKDSDDFGRLVEYRTEYQSGARRFDVGARTAFELTPMALAALEQLSAWTVPRIAVTLAATTARIASAARERGLPVPAPRGPHMLGITVPDGLQRSVVTALEEANVFVGARGSAIRISPHLHTTGADIEQLLTALDAALNRP
ncbi:aminotransferase class V-fold PLP-dependent enzyme [Streptomyces vinaceus]|uniref:Aminotransferase class V-fold PLP-dependent enzyme n=1 Tax=Streptomyces vinaceus TaxID=1960 RepID=A0A5J6J1N5_STRVI|nr:aminotransferase class V-fold PLP-dependent enzyme [Streptomyces vinaceus]QEV44002.1 aminotransferase class V-fold PLP-dependent enzyme [Streptomyces vinaceus]GHE75106.1 aminotransferase [Streptomyces vinaceus]